MRKFSLLFITVILVLSIALPGYAQDDQTSIGDILTERSSAAEPEFTLLMAALQAADPALWERLSDPDMVASTFTTLFAPTDAAFQGLLTALNLDAETVLADQALVTMVLAHHIVPGMFFAENFAANPGAHFGTFVPHASLTFAQEGDALKVNGANIVEADIEVFDGVIHVIDQVLLPPTLEASMMEMPEETIYDILSSREDFSIFKETMDSMGFQTDLMVTNYTLFLPTDDVFNAFFESVGITLEEFLENSDTSTPILFYHFLSGTFDAADLVAMQPEEGDLIFGTQQPSTFMTITVDGETVKADAASVVEADIYAKNGVIHVIDSILLPSGS